LAKNIALILLWTKSGVQISKDFIVRKLNKKLQIDYMQLKNLKRILPTFPSTFYFVDKKGNRYVILLTFDNVFFFPAELKEEEINRVFDNVDSKFSNLVLEEFKTKYEKLLKFAKIFPFLKGLFKKYSCIVIDADKKTINFTMLYYYHDRNFLVNPKENIAIPYNLDYALSERGKPVYFVLKKGIETKILKPTPESEEYFKEKEEIERQEAETIADKVASFYFNLKENIIIANTTNQKIEEIAQGEKGFLEKYGNILMFVLFSMIIIIGMFLVFGKLNDVLKITLEISNVVKEMTETVAVIKTNQTLPVKLS
jgi:hypothetical protein